VPDLVLHEHFGCGSVSGFTILIYYY